MSKRVLVTLNEEEYKKIEEVAKDQFKHRMATALRELALRHIEGKNFTQTSGQNTKSPATSAMTESMVS